MQGTPVGDGRRQRQAEGIANPVAQALPDPQLKESVSQTPWPIGLRAKGLSAVRLDHLLGTGDYQSC